MMSEGSHRNGLTMLRNYFQSAGIHAEELSLQLENEYQLPEPAMHEISSPLCGVAVYICQE